MVFNDRELDAHLHANEEQDAVVYQLSEQVEHDLLTTIEGTVWYRLNVRVRPETTQNVKSRILEEARKVAQTYANQPWLQGERIMDEATIVQIYRWCYQLRGTLEQDPHVGIKTSFLTKAGDRLRAGLEMEHNRDPSKIKVDSKHCMDFVKRLWDKGTGHRAAADAKYKQGNKRLRQELNEEKLKNLLLERVPPRNIEPVPQLPPAQIQLLPGIDDDPEEADPAGRVRAAGRGRAGARARGRGAR